MSGRSITAWCLVAAAAALLQGCGVASASLIDLGMSKHSVRVWKTPADDRVVISHTRRMYGNVRTEWAAIAVPAGGETREYRFSRYRIKAAEGKELAAKGRSLCDMGRYRVAEWQETSGQEYYWGDGTDTVIRALDGGKPPRYVTMIVDVPYSEEGIGRHPSAYPLIAILVVPAVVVDVVTFPIQMYYMTTSGV